MLSNSKGREKVTDVNPEVVAFPHDPEFSSGDSESESESSQSNRELDTLIGPSKLPSNATRKLTKGNSKSKVSNQDSEEEEEVIIFQEERKMVAPPKLYEPYIKTGKSRWEGPSSIRDPAVERLNALTDSWSAPAPPIPPPELSQSGKPLTKRERKELRQKTAGPGWFDLPAPSEAELPRMYREVEALRLHNQLDPKRFYKKEEGEGKGIKGLPKYFAIGKILPTTTPFGGKESSDNLPRAQRKRTLVDELVDDAEAKRYAKRKFEDLQSLKSAKGRSTLHAKQALRKQKW